MLSDIQKAILVKLAGNNRPMTGRELGAKVNDQSYYDEAEKLEFSGYIEMQTIISIAERYPTFEATITEDGRQVLKEE